jgi:hypothetical protein
MYEKPNQTISIEWTMILEYIYMLQAGGVIKYDSFMNEKNEQGCCFFFDIFYLL